MAIKPKLFVLVGKSPVAAASLEEWAERMDFSNRHVADDAIAGARVSTVFLGMDHSRGSGPPQLFETMIFGGPLDQEQWRCSTWEEAEAQHAKALALAVEKNARWTKFVKSVLHIL